MTDETIEVGTDVETGEPVELPVVDVLTGRNFTTGKSGSGKSNTLSVVAEKLLDRGYALMIVDVEGEYYGLKEEYELLHAGADEECDVQVGAEHAERLATLALEENVPIILDVSGFLDEDDARSLIRETARHLFAKEKKRKQPFLLAVEEIHEYIPQQGGLDDVGQMLVKVAKRGRKHGLGLAGVSQRPADVKKDVITQCDWLVWHRLTWENDTKVARRVLGDTYGDAIETLDDGEAFLQTDWSESIQRVAMHRKRTFDAGATPGLEDVEQPDLKGIGADLVDQLEAISERQAERQDELAQKEARIEALENEVAGLEEDLAAARDVQDLAEQFAQAMTSAATGGDASEQAVEEIQAEVLEVRESKRALEDSLDDVRAERDRLQERVDELEAQAAPPELAALRDDVAELITRNRGVLPVDGDHDADDRVAALRERVRELEAANEDLRKQADTVSSGDDLAALLQHDAVQTAVATAKQNSDRASEHFDHVLAILASADRQLLPVSDVAPLTDVSDATIRRVLQELHTTGLVRREKQDRAHVYGLDRDFLERRIEVASQEARVAGGTDAG